MYTYMQFIAVIALVLTLLAACFAWLFWRLSSRFAPQECSPSWLEEFSVESYAPMARLLERSDVEFLKSQAGYRPEIGRRLMIERRRIFRAFLDELVTDFHQLIGIGKLMVVYSPHDAQEFDRQLWGHQIRFYAEVCAVRMQLALYPLGWTVVDAHRLVTALQGMRSQVQLLVSPGQRQLETV